MTKHLSQEELLRYLDGELSKSAMQTIAAHLQACWSCNVEFDRLKEHIAAILDAETNFTGPSAPPPRPWPRLDKRLDEAMDRATTPLWKRLFPIPERHVRWRMAYGLAGLALTLVVLSVLRPEPVSAREALRRAAEADTARLTISGRQVARQRVRVRRTARRAASARDTQLEAWQTTKAAYWNSGADPVSAELRARYQANGLDAALPLSPQTVESWVKIAGAEPSASETRESIDVQVVSAATGKEDGLEGVALHVRRDGWHVDEMTLSFADVTYRIVEEESVVLTRANVPPDVLALLEPQTAPREAPASAPALATGRDGARSNLDDLEMEIRHDLHTAGADLDGSLEISQSPPDEVVVNASRLPAEMREKVAALLGKRSGARVELHEPATAGSDGRITRIIPPAASPSDRSDPRLTRFLESENTPPNYVRFVLENSNNVLTRLHALRSLAMRWPPEQEARLSSGAKARLRAIVENHAKATRLAAAELSQRIAPLVTHFGHTISAESAVTVEGPWQQAGVSGLAAAQRTDRTLRSLLTTSEMPLSPDEGIPMLVQGMRDLDRAVRVLPE
jgi:hypothetical protein